PAVADVSMDSGIAVQYIKCDFKFTIDLTNTYSCEIHLITDIVKSFRVLAETLHENKPSNYI
ncbi:MAG: hypothetical protein KJ687_08265, partial [Proteobacteria bacterium]|nr:hypothetical protein [Pseudomonadota bacterium]